MWKGSLLGMQTECYYFDGNEWNIELNLVSNQEKAVSRMTLQLNHTLVVSNKNIIVYIPDTCLSCHVVHFGKPLSTCLLKLELKENQAAEAWLKILKTRI